MPTATRAGTASAFERPAARTTPPTGARAPRRTAEAPAPSAPPARPAEAAAPNLYEPVLAELFGADSYLHRRQAPAARPKA